MTTHEWKWVEGEWQCQCETLAPRTDHSADIARLRSIAVGNGALRPSDRIDMGLAADLLELHDMTGISLDAWRLARSFVERHIGHTITENGA